MEAHVEDEGGPWRSQLADLVCPAQSFNTSHTCKKHRIEFSVFADYNQSTHPPIHTFMDCWILNFSFGIWSELLEGNKWLCCETLPSVHLTPACIRAVHLCVGKQGELHLDLKIFVECDLPSIRPETIQGLPGTLAPDFI